jgi:integrase
VGAYIRPDSPYWWLWLEGHGREPTKIRHDARSSVQRKALRDQAEAIYHARMVQLERGRAGLPVDTGETFASFVTWYAEHRAEKHRSADRTRVILATLSAHFGALALSDIKPARWSEYETARLAAGVTTTTIGRELATMKSVLNAAVGQHIEVNPLIHVKRKTVKLPPKRTLTKDDEARLLTELHDDEIRDLYLVGVGTLLRQVNLIMLRRRDYEADRVVVDTKTGPHQVPLTGPTTLQRRAAMVLKRRLPKTHGGFFFPKWQARFEKDRNGANAKFLQGFRRACTRANIPWGLGNRGVVWHTATRASGATRMLREHGIDIRTVQLIGGWSSLDQMAAYLGLDIGAQVAPADRKRNRA